MTGKHSTTTRPELVSLLSRALDVLRERPGLAEVVAALVLEMHTALSNEWARANAAEDRHEVLLTKLEVIWSGFDDWGDLGDVIRGERS